MSYLTDNSNRLLNNTKIKTSSGFFLSEEDSVPGFVEFEKVYGNSVQLDVPSPSNYVEVDSFEGSFAACKRNLFNIDKCYARLSTIRNLGNNSLEFIGTYGIELDIFIPKNSVVRVSWKKNKQTKYNHYNLYFDNGTVGEGANGAHYGIRGRDVRKIVIGITDHLEKVDVILSDIMIEAWLDDEPTFEEHPPHDFEPYCGVSSPNFTLRSLPKGSADTLYRNLENNGSYFLSQKIDYIELDGSENWTTKDYPFNNKMYVLEDFRYFERFDASAKYGAYCTRYVNKEDIATTGEVGFFIGGGIGHYTFHVVTPEQTLEEFKNNLKKYKQEGKPLRYYGYLKSLKQIEINLPVFPTYADFTNIVSYSKVPAELNEITFYNHNYMSEKFKDFKNDLDGESFGENLILNGDFLHPINTSGRTEFLYETNDRRETIDGWSFSGGLIGKAKAILTSEGFLLDCGSEKNGIQLSQDFSIEDSQKLSGKTVTLVVDYENYNNSYGTVGIQIVRYGSYVKSVEPPLYSDQITYSLPKITNEQNFKITIGVGSNNITPFKRLYKSVKLFLGDKAKEEPYIHSTIKNLELGKYPLLYGGKEIKSNVDLNNLVSIGTYYCMANAIAETLKNKPAGLNKAFIMTIKSGVGVIMNGTDYYNYFLQTIETYSNEVYRRNITVHKNVYSFSGWRKFTTEADTAAAAEVSKLDTIENLVRKSQTDIIDEYTLSLIDSGVIK